MPHSPSPPKTFWTISSGLSGSNAFNARNVLYCCCSDDPNCPPLHNGATAISI